MVTQIKGRGLLVSQAKGETCWSLKQTLTLLHKKGPRHRKMCKLWLYSYYTQLSPMKNKNINCIFIYPWVLRCLSSSAICDTCRLLSCSLIIIPEIRMLKYSWWRDNSKIEMGIHEKTLMVSVYCCLSLWLFIQWNL